MSNYLKSGMSKKPTPKPTKKADKACYDLAHRAWLAGAISDFRYGTDSNSWAVAKADARGVLGWTVGDSFTTDTAVATRWVETELARAGISGLAWGPRWIGRRSVVIVRGEVCAA